MRRSGDRADSRALPRGCARRYGCAAPAAADARRELRVGARRRHGGRGGRGWRRRRWSVAVGAGGGGARGAAGAAARGAAAAQARQRSGAGRSAGAVAAAVPARSRPASGGGQPREWYRGIPIPPNGIATFTRRNNTNYMETGVLSALQLTSMFPQLILENFYVKTQNSMEHGTNKAPYGYVIPGAARHDPRRDAA